MNNFDVSFKTINENNSFFSFRDLVRECLIGYPTVTNFEKEIQFVGKKINIPNKGKLLDIVKQTMFDISKTNVEIYIENKPNLFEFDINNLAHFSIMSYKERQRYKMKIIATMFGIMYFEWIKNNTRKRPKIKKINGSNSAIYEATFSFKKFNDLENFCVLNGIFLKKI